MSETELKTELADAPTDTSETPQPAEPAKSRGQYNPVTPKIKKKSLGQILLYCAAVAFGLLALDFLVQIPRWMKDSHVRRVQRIVDTSTPASVLAHCGQPLNDVTEDLYPMIARRMTYNSALSAQSGSPKVVLFFSRTAEENSQWLYSSMRDEAGPTTYNTPDEQMAALPCLASTK